jgi:hypothetical protein
MALDFQRPRSMIASILVDMIGAEQSSGSTRAERAGADELGVDASAGVAGVGSMAQGVGDKGRFDGGPVVDTGVVIVEQSQDRGTGLAWGIGPLACL